MTLRRFPTWTFPKGSSISLPKTLKAQLLIYGTVSLLIATGLIAWLEFQVVEADARREVQEHMVETATALAAALERASPQTAQSVLAAFQRVAATNQVLVLDQQGVVVLSTHPADIGKPVEEVMGHPEPKLGEVLAGQLPQVQEPMTEVTSVTNQNLPVLALALPLHDDPADFTRVTGALFYLEPNTQYTNLLQQSLLRYFLSDALLIALLMVPLWFFLERGILRPVRRIVEANRAVAEGQREGMTTKVTSVIPDSVIPNNEIGEIARSRQEMLTRLEAAHEELRQRLKELADLNATAALFEFSQRLLAANDEHAVMELAVEVVASALRAEFSALVLPDSEGRLFVRAARGWSADLVGRLELQREHASQTGYTVLSGRPAAVADYARETAFTVPAVVSEYGIVSGLSVPMFREERVVGAILVHSRAPRHFGDDEIRLLSLIANQTALALGQAQLLATERRRADEMDALHSIAQVVGSSLELKQVLKHIAQRTAQACRANRCTIFLLDDAGQVLQPVMSQFADGHIDLEQWQDFKAATADQVDVVPLFRAAIRERRPALLDDAARTDLVPLKWTQPFGIQKLLAVPLVSRDQAIGLMALDHTEANREFTQEQINLALTIGGQVTSAITNARLYAEAERRGDQLRALHEASFALTSDLHLQTILETLVETARRLVSARYAALAVLDAEGTRSAAQFHTAGLSEEERQQIGAPPQGRGLLGVLLRDGVPIRIADIARDPRAEGFPPHHPLMKSFLGVPIVARGKVLGSLYLTDKSGEQPFTQEDENLIMGLAADAAIAIENARLFAEVQRLAITDSLTGLYNRGHFFELAEREFQRARRYGRPVAAIMLDIDHFKQVNDTYSHAVGDEVLRAVVERSRKNLRDIDVLGRYGGEEFVAVLPETDLDGTRDVAERLRRCMAEVPIITAGGLVTITISLGIAISTEDCPNVAALINQADAGMYAAKTAGRNRVKVASREERHNAHR